MIFVLSILLVEVTSSNVSLQEENINEVENPAKLIEEYVVAADFDNRPVPQIQIPTFSDKPSWEEGEAPTESSHQPIKTSSRIVADKMEGNVIGDIYPYMMMAPPQYMTDSSADRTPQNSMMTTPTNNVMTERSVFAVGFVVFLLLLSSLQNNMLNMSTGVRRPNTSLLGGAVQSLGRKRRSLDLAKSPKLPKFDYNRKNQFK